MTDKAAAAPSDKPLTAGDLIPLETAARLLMISAERVRQLIKDGYIPRPVPGRTTLVGAVQGYIRFRDDADRRATKSASANRVTDARASEIELRLAERRREVIPREEAEAANAFVVGLVNEELNGLPARLTRDVPTRRKYEAEVDGSKARIAKALADAAEHLETSKPLPHSDTSDDT